MQSETVDFDKSGRKASFAFYFFLFLVLVGIDQITKYLVFTKNWLAFLNFKSVGIYQLPFKNYWFAFSLNLPPVVMYAVYFVILFFIFRYVARNFFSVSRPSQWAWVLILAGAFANLIERIILGYVRDFVYIFSGVFNFADFYIILGIAILLGQSVFKQSPS